MSFLKGFLTNLLFIVAIGVVLFIVAPDMMKQVFQLYGGLFGPVLVMVLIFVAAPAQKKS
jgi:uncharacterized membrane protein YedE/YeeE